MEVCASDALSLMWTDLFEGLTELRKTLDYSLFTGRMLQRTQSKNWV